MRSVWEKPDSQNGNSAVMKKAAIAAMVLIGGLLVVLLIRSHRNLNIDACLNMGGKWDYVKGACVDQRTK